MGKQSSIGDSLQYDSGRLVILFFHFCDNPGNDIGSV